jgi:hypothetical protein
MQRVHRAGGHVSRPSLRSLLLTATALTAVLGAVVAAVPANAGGHRARAVPLTWAPASTAAIHPGVQTVTGGSQCTSNFVFDDGSGNVYIGQAAHCSGTGAATDTNGCTSASLPIGTPVDVAGISHAGTMVYNSWLTMQARGEKDQNGCQYNDFALIKLAPAYATQVNPSIPFWGGPTGLGDSRTSVGEKVYSYGNSWVRFGVLLQKVGVSAGDQGTGWSHLVYTATPGIPGDSGSAFLDADGRAIGVLSTLDLAPYAGSNGVGDITKEIAYMHAYSAFGGVNLVPGTETFNPPV